MSEPYDLEKDLEDFERYIDSIIDDDIEAYYREKNGEEQNKYKKAKDGN